MVEVWTHTSHCHHVWGFWPYMPLGRTYMAREGAEAGCQLNLELVSPAQHPVTCSGVVHPPPQLCKKALTDITTKEQAELEGQQSALYRHPSHLQGPCSLLALKSMADSGYKKNNSLRNINNKNHLGQSGLAGG